MTPRQDNAPAVPAHHADDGDCANKMENAQDARFRIKMNNAELHSIYDLRWMRCVYHCLWCTADQFTITYSYGICICVLDPWGRIVYKRGNLNGH